MKDQNAGLEQRYVVRKLNDPNGKHDSCWYFVLDPLHDPIARVALNAYARDARAVGLHALAEDLERKLREAERYRESRDG